MKILKSCLDRAQDIRNLIAHLVPGPGGAHPQLLSKGELEEQQGHPDHQQHHQERDDERSWKSTF